eukprot:7424049-Lingulodinium_polyedra.AAC.1
MLKLRALSCCKLFSSNWHPTAGSKSTTSSIGLVWNMETWARFFRKREPEDNEAHAQAVVLGPLRAQEGQQARPAPTVPGHALGPEEEEVEQEVQGLLGQEVLGQELWASGHQSRGEGSI